jgi:4-hydroxy-2-oxoheptanedioate aldolase
MRKKSEWLTFEGARIGPFVRIARPEIIELLAIAGFDFAIVDLEHGFTSPNEVYPLLLAAEAHNIKLIARLPGLDEQYTKWLLDMGVHGIQVPHVSTTDEARKVLRQSKFAPEGERGLCRFVRAARYSNLSKEEYINTANNKALVIIQIEGLAGARNINEIAALEGIDVIFVGPYDLSQSLGVPGQIWHESVVTEAKKIIKTCRDMDVEVGIFTDTVEGIKFWKGLGVKYISYKIDVSLILDLTKSHLMEARTKTGL